MAIMASNGGMVLEGVGKDVEYRFGLANLYRFGLANLYRGGQRKTPISRTRHFLPTRRMIRRAFLQSNENFDNEFKNQKR